MYHYLFKTFKVHYKLAEYTFEKQLFLFNNFKDISILCSSIGLFSEYIICETFRNLVGHLFILISLLSPEKQKKVLKKTASMKVGLFRTFE